MDSSLYCSCILHEKLIRQKHQLFLEKLLACQTWCFALFAQTSRLLAVMPSPPSDLVNPEFSALAMETLRREWCVNITEQFSAELHQQLTAVWSQTVNSVPAIHNSPRYTLPPTVLGHPGFLTEFPRVDLKEPSWFLPMKAMGVTCLAQQRQTLKLSFSWGGQQIRQEMQ